jgi:hypothetical protein
MGKPLRPSITLGLAQIIWELKLYVKCGIALIINDVLCAHIAAALAASIYPV